MTKHAKQAQTSADLKKGFLPVIRAFDAGDREGLNTLSIGLFRAGQATWAQSGKRTAITGILQTIWTDVRGESVSTGQLSLYMNFGAFLSSDPGKAGKVVDRFWGKGHKHLAQSVIMKVAARVVNVQDTARILAYLANLDTPVPSGKIAGWIACLAKVLDGKAMKLATTEQLEKATEAFFNPPVPPQKVEDPPEDENAKDAEKTSLATVRLSKCMELLKLAGMRVDFDSLDGEDSYAGLRKYASSIKLDDAPEIPQLAVAI